MNGFSDPRNSILKGPPLTPQLWAMEDPATNLYASRGASAAKEDVHAALVGVDKGLYPRAFCKILPDLAGGDAAFCNLMHADGAGTKSALAWAYWRETGDLSVWRGIAQDAVVMNTDDLLCVGATGPMLLSSTIGRNKRLVPGEVIKALIEGTEEVLAQMRSWGLNIQSCGGETADLGDVVRTVLVDSTVFARMPRAQVIDQAKLGPGLAIVGIASYGQATYETTFNSGMGSNGLTSARHDIFSKAVVAKYPEIQDPTLDRAVAYRGPYGLTHPFPGLPLNAGQAVLSPTRTYVPFVLALFQTLAKDAIRGMIHCTGGGQTKILHFIDGVKIVKDTPFAVPPLFAEIQRCSGASWKEMYQVFNMGHRLEFYVEPTHVDTILQVAASFNLEAQVVGHTEPHEGKALEVHGPEGVIKY